VISWPGPVETAWPGPARVNDHGLLALYHVIRTIGDHLDRTRGDYMAVGIPSQGPEGHCFLRKKTFARFVTIDKTYVTLKMEITLMSWRKS